MLSFHSWGFQLMHVVDLNCFLGLKGMTCRRTLHMCWSHLLLWNSKNIYHNESICCYWLVLWWFELGGHWALFTIWRFLKSIVVDSKSSYWMALSVNIHPQQSVCQWATTSPSIIYFQRGPTVHKCVQSTAIMMLRLTGKVAKNITQILRRKILRNIAYNVEKALKTY